MIRTYQPADLDRLMQLWLQGNLQAHPFVPASYWEENAPDVRRQLPQAQLFLYEDAEGVQGFLGWWTATLRGSLSMPLRARKESATR